MRTPDDIFASIALADVYARRADAYSASCPPSQAEVYSAAFAELRAARAKMMRVVLYEHETWSDRESEALRVLAHVSKAVLARTYSALTESETAGAHLDQLAETRPTEPIYDAASAVVEVLERLAVLDA